MRLDGLAARAARRHRRARPRRGRLREGGPHRPGPRAGARARSSPSTSTTTTTTRASATSTSSSPDASSTGEVLRDVFRELGVELTPEIAEPLYIALVTDTGRFQYTNTTPKSLRLAAELVDAGADVHAVFQQVYESVEFAKLKLLARALERARVLEGGRIVVSVLMPHATSPMSAPPSAYSEGIIDYLRAVEGSELAVLIREPPRRGSADEARLAALERRRGRRVRDRADLRRRRTSARRPASRATRSVDEITETVRERFLAQRARTSA